MTAVAVATPTRARRRPTPTPPVIIDASTDRPVAPMNRWEPGKQRWVPLTKNTVGITPVAGCPDHTEACSKACYAKYPWPNVANLLARNLAAVQAATYEQLVTAYGLVVDGYVIEHQRHHPHLPMVFRWFWSGDVLNEDNARAVAEVARTRAHVEQWIYTRSFRWLEHLTGIDNLAVYLSADEDNYLAAELAAAEHGLPIAYMGEHVPRRAMPLRPVLCPKTNGRMPMVLDDGRGACAVCRACIRGVRDVVFRIH